MSDYRQLVRRRLLISLAMLCAVLLVAGYMAVRADRDGARAGDDGRSAADVGHRVGADVVAAPPSTYAADIAQELRAMRESRVQRASRTRPSAVPARRSRTGDAGRRAASRPVRRLRSTHAPSPAPDAGGSRRASGDGSTLGARAHQWANTPKARSVSNCESGGNPCAVNPSGKYRGKWQMDSSFWSSYGGLNYASRPDLASEYDQDIVAYRGWLARGWSPWSCA